MPLHVSSTMCPSSGGQNCIIQPLVSLHWNEWSKITKITKLQFYKYSMEEAPENGKESPHSVHANGLIDWAYSSKMYVWIFRVWLLCITYYKHIMPCRGYVYPIIKLIRKILCLCYYYMLIFIYFSNFSYFSNFRPPTCFSVMMPEAV